MNRVTQKIVGGWVKVSPRFLPFADAATAELPLPRLLRLSLFQVSVGLNIVLLIGTLNRVLIVEFGAAAWLVALMVALPIAFAPFRALVGFRSDTYRSALGWKRVPFIWYGSLLQFGGLAIMPFALLVLTGGGRGPAWTGQIGAALAFLLVGSGMQITQTAGLALATDLAPEKSRPRVVALMYVMLLLGMVVCGLVFGLLLHNFTALRLIQVVQGSALVSAGLNLVALWKQEARSPSSTRGPEPGQADFSTSWRGFIRQPQALRFLVALALGTAGYNMQDIVLEPYGGEVLHLSVGATTSLTAMMAAGALAAFALVARMLGRGADPIRVSAYGLLVGVPAFTAVIMAAPLNSPWLFRAGTIAIGFGGGLFSVGTLMVAMGMETREKVGLALGAWGAVQATAGGIGIALGGAMRDVVHALANQQFFGAGFVGPTTGYMAVYHVELALLFVTLIAIGPLVRHRPASAKTPVVSDHFGLAELSRQPLL
jgi:BCD family chlorophyll transporter-like MFS transporter